MHVLEGVPGGRMITCRFVLPDRDCLVTTMWTKGYEIMMLPTKAVRMIWYTYHLLRTAVDKAAGPG